MTFELSITLKMHVAKRLCLLEGVLGSGEDNFCRILWG